MDETTNRPNRPDADLPRRERTPVEVLRDWETVQQNDTDETQRLRVARGWLYRTFGPAGLAMVFVPE